MRKFYPALRVITMVTFLVSSVVYPVVTTGAPAEAMLKAPCHSFPFPEVALPDTFENKGLIWGTNDCPDETEPVSESEADQVILITIDGLNPQAVVEMGNTRLPNLHHIIEEGASTQNARTASEMTTTLPNHSTVYTGWTIDDHGVTFNRDDGRTIHHAADRHVSSVFSVAHDNGLSTALYAGKTKFDFLDRSWDEDHGNPDTIGIDDGPDKIDHYERGDGAEMTANFSASMAQDPFDLSILHYAEVDVAAHEFGYGSDAYRQAVMDVDGWIGEIVDIVDGDLAGDTVMIVTADHGTDGTTHGDEADPANYTIPFYLWGDDIPRGDLYGLAGGTRSDPGDTQPTYGAVRQPIRNGDAANLVLDLFDLGPVPGSTFNTGQDLVP